MAECLADHDEYWQLNASDDALMLFYSPLSMRETALQQKSCKTNEIVT